MAAARPEIGDQEHRQAEGDDADREVDGEDRAPAEMGDEEAADGRPGDHSEARDDAVDGEHPASLLDREQRHHQRKALRREQRGAKALQPAREDQLGRVLCQGAESGRDGEDHDADGKKVARPVDVAEPCRGDQQHGVQEAVGVEHPQHLVEARVKTVKDRRDRDVDDRQIEQGHEEAEHEHAQRGHRVVANAGHGVSSPFGMR